MLTAAIRALNLLRIGAGKQTVLEPFGNGLRINWALFYIGVPLANATHWLAGFFHHSQSRSKNVPVAVANVAANFFLLSTSDEPRQLSNGPFSWLRKGAQGQKS